MKSADEHCKTPAGARRAATPPPAFAVEGAVEVVGPPDPVVVVVDILRVELDDPVLELAELVFALQPGGALPKLMLTTAATLFQLF
jgi:hypothetical protein